MPDWINSSDLFSYFYYFKHNQIQSNAKKLLQIADFFENTKIVEKIIEREIIPNLNEENSLAYLEDSFQKLSTRMSGEQIWFILFKESMESVAENLIYYLQNQFKLFVNINKKLLEEIVEK